MPALSRFETKIKIVNGNPYVSVPARITGFFDVRGYVKVLAKPRGRTAISLCADTSQFVQPMAPFFRAALSKNRGAKAAWDRQSPSCHKKVLHYMNFAKSAETVARNVTRIITRLQASKRIY